MESRIMNDRNLSSDIPPLRHTMLSPHIRASCIHRDNWYATVHFNIQPKPSCTQVDNSSPTKEPSTKRNTYVSVLI